MSVLVFLLFSGEDSGEDLADGARLAGLLTVERFRFGLGPVREAVLSPLRFVDASELRRLRNGRKTLSPASFSSSDMTVVDLRGRFEGRGFDDISVTRYHVGSNAVIEGQARPGMRRLSYDFTS